MKKLLALLMALTMTCQLVVPTWAEEIPEELEESTTVVEAEAVEETPEPTEAALEEPEEETEVSEEPEEEHEETEEPTEETAAPEELQEEAECASKEADGNYVDIGENEAASGACGDHLYWAMDGNGVLTISGYGRMWDYDVVYNNEMGIPYSSALWAKLNPRKLIFDEGITYVGKCAFYGCTSLTGSLTLPEGITKVGAGAFEGCDGFSGRLSLPETLRIIGSNAFDGCCGFTGDLTLPDGVTSIESMAFSGCCGFTGDLTLPDGVTSIESMAFSGCGGFTGNLTLPEGITSIEKSVFSDCSGLTGNLILPEGITRIDRGAFSGCSGFTGELVLPSNLVSIKTSAFSGCSGFTGDLVIPPNVQTIEMQSFYGCQGFNGRLVLPNGLSSIQGSAFGGCNNLRGNLELPNSLTVVGWEAFYDCSGFDGNLILPESIVSIGAYAFGNCSNLIGSLEIPASVKEIGEGAFSGCSGFDGNLILPESIVSIGWDTFYECKGLTAVEIPETVTDIADRAFYGCNGITDVYYHGVKEQWNLITIGKDNGCLTNAELHCDSAPAGTAGSCGEHLTWYLDRNSTLVIAGWGNMTDYSQEDRAPWAELAPRTVVFQGDITHIGSYAFQNCTSLEGKLSLPVGLTSIGESAFENCGGLTMAEIYASIADIEVNAFSNCSGLEKILFHGESSLWDAINVDSGNESLDRAEVCCGTGGSCGESLLWFLDNTGTLKIFGTGKMNDYWCRGPWGEYQNKITRVVIDSGVTSIGSNAFACCENFKSIILPEGLERIGDGAFDLCTELTEVRIPDSVFRIEKGAFSGCYSMENLVLPKGLACISNGVFNGCRSLKTLVIPDSVTHIEDNAFMNCLSITELHLPSGIQKIGHAAFSQCYSLSGPLVLPETLRSIGGSAFSMTGFEGTLVLPQNLETLGSGAFSGCYGLTGDLILPDSLHDIPDKAFMNCTGMTGKLVLPQNLESVGDWAFYNCGFTGSLDLPDTLVNIGYSAFQGCLGLTGDLVIPESVTTVGKQSFANCSGFDGRLILPGELRCIDEFAFYGCSGLTGSVTLPENLQIICNGAFAKTGISEFIVSQNHSVFSAVDGVLYSQNQTELLACPGGKQGWVDVSEKTVRISDYAFCGCNEMTAVSIPISLKKAGECAFEGCDKLTDVYYAGTRERWKQIRGVTQLSGRRLHLSYSIFYRNVPEGLENPNPTTGTADSAIVLQDLVRPGYSFVGWYSADVGGIKITQISDGNNGDITLYARWAEKGYTIAFNGNGSVSGTTERMFVLSDIAVALPDCKFVHPGYTFTGWNTRADGKGKAYQPGSTVKNLAESGSVTLYAQWKLGTYTASFGPGEGEVTGTTKPMTKLVHGKTYAAPKCGFSRKGYVFTGWQLDEEHIYKAGQKFKVDGEDLVFTALWTPITYKVRFNANKGSGKMADQTGFVYDEGQALTECGFTRNGYSFMGWNTRADGKGTGYEDGEKVKNLTASNNAVVTLYAQWTPNTYTVTFHGEKEEDLKTQTLTYDRAEALDRNSGENPFVRPGYTFAGWKDAKGKAYKDGAKVINLGGGKDTDLYAQWTAKKYTVVFHSGLTKDTTKKQVLTYGKEAKLAANSFVWKGRSVQGWATEKGGEKVYDNGASSALVLDPVPENGTIHLYAVWAINTYTVVFDGNGADGSMEPKPMTYDQPAQLTANTFARPGYTFTGWSTTAKGAVKYRDGVEVKNLTDKNGGQIRLYAVWFKGYMVNFDKGGDNVTGTMNPVKMASGKTYTLPSVAFKRTGYSFVGWSVGDETYKNKDRVKNLAENGVVTLTAQWKLIDYTVAYQGLTAAERENLRKTYTVVTTEDPGTPERPGCKFEGWFLDAKFKKPFSGFQGRTGKLTLYPKWSGAASKYTVAYAPGAEGTTGSVSKQTGLACGKEYAPKACAFKRPGYLFNGWLLPDGTVITTKQKFSNLCQADGDTVTLKATWKPITYKVRFNANKGTGKMADQTGIVYDVSTALKDCTFTRKGYTFAGWNTRTDGKGRDITEALNLTGTNNGTVTLYAKWTKNP